VQSTVKGLKRKRKGKKQRHTPPINFISCIKNIKKLRSKSVRSFFKEIPKSLGSSCNARPKSNIYNINNNIKLT